MSDNNSRTQGRESQGPPQGGFRGPMGGGPGFGRPGMAFEKARDFKGTWGKITRYCRKYMPAIIASLIIAAVGTSLQIMGPDRIGKMVDEIVNGVPMRLEYEKISEELSSAESPGAAGDAANEALATMFAEVAASGGDSKKSLYILCEMIYLKLELKTPEGGAPIVTEEPEGSAVKILYKLRSAFMPGSPGAGIPGDTTKPSDTTKPGDTAKPGDNPTPEEKEDYKITIEFPSGCTVNVRGNERNFAPGTTIILDSKAVTLNGRINLDNVKRIAFLLIAFYATALLLSLLENYIMATITARISKNMRTSISQKINKLPFKYFDKTSYGDIISRVTNDVDTIGQTMNQNLDNFIKAITQFVGSMIMMFINSWVLALTAIFSSIIGFMLMTLMMSKSRKYFRAQQKGLGDVNGHIEEIYTGHNVVKAYNGGKEARKTFEVINNKLYESGWKSQFLSGLMMPVMHFVGNLGYVAVCVVGAALAMLSEGEPFMLFGFIQISHISFGVIAAFMIYIRQFTQPLQQFAQSMQALQRTAAAGERVFEFLEEDELADESGKTKRIEGIRGNVEFKNVQFGYDKDKTIIHDFSAKIKDGQKIAIVGPTGAGKTTMVNLLMRFYEIDSGEIALDGVPTSAVTRENVHEQFCMVLQDTWLFEGTIKENIIYSKPGVSDEDVVAACRASGLHHFIRTLPDGYDTVLNDKASLSEGQKQLLTIARAIVQNAPLLILDEATSSVDTRTEVLVQRAMDKLTKGRTSFVIAHRLSTIRNADLILFMHDGDIVESGSHNELVAKEGGFYATMYNSQFE